MNNLIAKLRQKKNSKKGFTLMEMLIVVAIIAILVAVSIPVFTSQLDKAKEQTDLANERAAKALVVTEYLTDPSISSSTSDIEFYYDAVNGKLIKITGVTTAPAPPKPYGQMKDHKDDCIKITIKPNGEVTPITWSPGTTS